jgi:hypothetical protein
VTGSWTFRRRLAPGSAATVAAFAIVAITGLGTTRSPAARDERADAGATRPLQTSSQSTSLSTSLTRRVQAT